MVEVSVIWIEIVSRQRDVIIRHRVAGSEARVGRAYDNDVVIDDPHVAPQHIRIARDEAGVLVAVDCGTLNGIFADRGKRRLDRVALDGDGLIRIGETWLRIRDQNAPVPAERPVTVRHRRWPYVAVLAVLILGIEITSTWLHETSESKISNYLPALAIIVGITVPWVTIWTVLSRVFSGAAKLERHLLVALGALLAYSVYSEFADIAAFAFSWPGLLNTWPSVIFIGTLGLAAFCHLVVIGRSRLWWKSGFTVACVAVSHVSDYCSA